MLIFFPENEGDSSRYIPEFHVSIFFMDEGDSSRQIPEFHARIFRYEYFQRMVPPDRFQSSMLLDVMQHYGFTYFSMFYVEGSYGENGVSKIWSQKRRRGMCVDLHMKISDYHTEEDIYDAVVEISKNRNSRAIIAFVFSTQYGWLVNAIARLGLLDHFLLLSVDGACSTPKGRYPPPTGMFCITFPRISMPDFTDHYVNIDPFGDAATPWVAPAWEVYLECSWTNSSMQSCHNVSLHDVRANLEIKMTTSYRLYDGVYVFAHALHQLVQDQCPEVFQRQANITDCVDGERLLPYVRNVRFSGYIRDIEFDENGDMLSGYALMQLIINEHGEDELVEVGNWFNGRLEIYPGAVDFTMFNATTHEDPIPVSVCSLPCGVRQYYYYTDDKCCWDCRTCRSNEYISENHEECIPCPPHTWPDEHTALTCVNIPITSLGADHPIGIAIAVTGGFGCLFSVLVMVIMAVKRKARLVKACSRELSSVSLMGTLLASITAFMFVIYPSDSVCVCRRLLFHMSVSMIFTPILAKTSRVYRIFSSARKSQKRPRFISPRAQMVITGMLLAMQVILLISRFRPYCSYCWEKCH